MIFRPNLSAKAPTAIEPIIQPPNMREEEMVP